MAAHGRCAPHLTSESQSEGFVSDKRVRTLGLVLMANRITFKIFKSLTYFSRFLLAYTLCNIKKLSFL